MACTRTAAYGATAITWETGPTDIFPLLMILQSSSALTGRISSVSAQTTGILRIPAGSPFRHHQKSTAHRSGTRAHGSLEHGLYETPRSHSQKACFCASCEIKNDTLEEVQVTAKFRLIKTENTKSNIENCNFPAHETPPENSHTSSYTENRIQAEASVNMRIPAGAACRAKVAGEVLSPVLWSPDSPDLYTLETGSAC